MGKPPGTTRLAHFLQAYEPLEPSLVACIYDRVHRLGCSCDDPVSLQIALDAIAEARGTTFLVCLEELVTALPRTIARVVATEREQEKATRRHDLDAQQTRSEAALRQTLGEAVRCWLPTLERHVHSAVVVRHLAMTLFVMMLAGPVGYIAGRHDTAAIGAHYAALAQEPDAETWLAVQSANGDLDHLIAARCVDDDGALLRTQSGRAACDVPLWLEPPDSEQADTVRHKLLRHVKSLHVGIVWLTGVLFGVAVAVSVRVRRR